MSNPIERLLNSLISKKNATSPTFIEKNVAYPYERMLFGDSLVEKMDNRKFNRNRKTRLKEVLKSSKPIEPDYQMSVESTAVDVPQFNLGGFLQDIAPLVSAIPGAGPIGTGLDLVGDMVDRESKGSSKVYGLSHQLKLGGPNKPIKKAYQDGGDFKQYNAPSHEMGGQMIDANGNPASNGIAEIEKQENSYKGFVYSDHLINPDTGNTYAQDANKIAKGTMGKDDISKSSRLKQLLDLRRKNSMHKQATEEGERELEIARNGLELDPLDFSVPLSTSPGVMNTFPLPTLDMISKPELKREFPYNRDMLRNDPRSNDFKVIGEETVEENNNLAPSPAPVEGNSKSLNPLAAGLKGASLAFAGIDALRPVEQEKQQQPDFSRGDALMQGLNIDMAPLMSEVDLATTRGISDLSNQATGTGQLNSRLNALLSRAGRNKAELDLKGQQANARIDAQSAAREDRNAQVAASERIRAQIAQSQNDAVGRTAARKFFSDLSQVGTTLNQIQYANDLMKNQNQNAIQAFNYGLSILNSKYPNFKVDQDFLERLNTGTLTEGDKPVIEQILKFVN